MDPNTEVHFMVMVYDEQPPPAIPTPVSLCPGARKNPRVRFASSVRLVTCRRCLQLLDVIGLSPADFEAGD